MSVVLLDVYMYRCMRIRGTNSFVDNKKFCLLEKRIHVFNFVCKIW